MKRLILMVLVGAFGLGASANAAVWIGGGYGVGDSDAGSLNYLNVQSGSAGANGYLKGFYTQASSKTIDVAGFKINVGHSMFGLGAGWKWGNSFIFHVGPQAGLSTVKAAVVVLGQTVSASSSDPFVGFETGLDWRLGFISLGAEGTYSYALASTAYGAYTGMGTVKFWFGSNK